MRNRLILFTALLLLSGNALLAQIVGVNVFMQGQWLEIGELPNGAFGPRTSPAGYHAHNCCSTSGFTTGAGMDMSYDWGHDGWTVGTPTTFMGPYGLPGYPQEGWAMQVAGVQTQAYCTGGGTYSGPGISGSITGYTHTPGITTGIWTGVDNGLTMTQWTRVDTEASWVVVTSLFKNLTGADIKDVYYMRTLDPDNAAYWSSPSGGYTTQNTIVHQNDIDHRVQVSAYDPGYGAASTYLALGTKDCRAMAFICPGLVPTSVLSDIYTHSGTATVGSGYFYTGSNKQDQGIGIVWNIGTIKSGDSAIISYAYIFDNDNGIDSALPDPELSVNGNVVTAFPDTFDACAFPKLDSVPLDLIFAEDKDWSWSKWSWSPGTGLSATTGAHIFADLTALPGAVTYTVTGVDSAHYMYSCNMRTFVFTLKSCHSAYNNDPCYGDVIRLGMRGDSTGATYFWKGPGGFTSTLHDPIISPAVFTDSGLYRVIKTIGGVNDTDSTYVTVYPKPVLALTSNGPLCSGMVDTLLLSVLPVSPGETFSWTGPNGFTSSLSNPSIPGFISVNAGIYTLIGVSAQGCKDTNTVNVAIVPPPPPPPINGIPVYCYGAPFVPLNITGSGILWYYPTSTSTPTTVPPVVNTKVPGTYTFWATQTFGCISPQDSFTVVVKPQILPNFTWSTLLGCESDIVTFNNTSTQAQWYTWDFGDGTGSSDTIPPAHAYKAHQVYSVTLTAFTPGCSTSIMGEVNTNHVIVAQFNPSPVHLCVGETIQNDSFATMNNSSYATEPAAVGGSPSIGNLTGSTAGSTNILIDTVPVASYAWDFGDGSTDNVKEPNAHHYAHGGQYTIKLAVTDSIGCVNTTTRNVYVLDYGIKITHDTMLCISQPLPLKNVIYGNPDMGWPKFTYSWSPSIHLDDTTVQVPYYTGFGLTTYTLTATQVDWGCIVSDTMRIHSVQGVKLSHVTQDATIMYGNKIQLNADSEIFYLWKPDDGSISNPNINDPVATPNRSTVYTVLGYDKNGCLDSAKVNVTVDSTMTEDIPSGFTPNGDGLNDVFRPVGTKFQNLVEFRVYNRWGQQLFYSNNPKVGWDGTFNGVPQDIDVYYYVIVIARPGGDGNNIVYKGEVTLIR